MAIYLGRFQTLAKPSSEWTLDDAVLKLGEFGTADPGATLPILKIGDGVRPFSALPPLNAPVDAANDYVAGTTTTLAPGSPATVVIDNSADPPTISFGIPAGSNGAAGAPGPANSLAIGTVTTGAPGSIAAATITGTPPAQTLNLSIPAGEPGATGPAGPAGIANFGNPSAQVGLAAINGVSTDAIRADGAPALSQAIVPTWTGEHRFSGVIASSYATTLNGVSLGLAAAGHPNILFRNPGAPVDAKNWGITTSLGAMVFTLSDDAGANPKSLMQFGRSGGVLTNILFGGSDNPTYTFAGTGLTTHNGPVEVRGAGPNIVLHDTVEPSDWNRWRVSGGEQHFRIGAINNADTVVKQAIEIQRVAVNITAMRFGNLIDDTNYTFQGAGTATFPCTVDLDGPLKADGAEGVSGQVLSSQGTGLPAVWRTASGGSIELGYNFSSAVGTANPGNQKMSLNSAVYASVTVAVFNSNAFTNFDANTILSLLAPGNRIYMQARADASRAAVYEVTAPGTQLTGYWTIPVTLINSRGAMFANNSDMNVVYILSTSASVSANPSATIGLTVVNGSATTWMRSDAAPPLSQAIAPTWSAIHTWTQPLRAASGSVSAPSYSFTAETNTGPYLASTGDYRIAVQGADRLQVVGGSAMSVRVVQGQLGVMDGTAADPGLAFIQQPSLGFFRYSSGILAVAVGGVGTTYFASTYLQSIGAFRSNAGLADNTGNLQYMPNTGALTYGTSYVTGAVGGYHGLVVLDGTLNPGLMSDGSTAGIYLQGTEGKWLLYRLNSGMAKTNYSLTAESYVAGAPTGGAMGTGTVNATGLYVNGVAVSTGGGASGANPSATIGLTAVNGSAGTFLRSDGAPALSQAIAPTWSAIHTWSQPLRAADGSAAAASYGFTNAVGTGLYLSTTNTLGIAAAGILAAAISSGGATFNVTLAVTAGSAGLAAYHFPGDLGTGLWSSGAGEVDLACGGVNRMSLTSSALTFGAGITATFQSSVTAVSFATTSARAVKRETGAPRYAADILAQLRPILYRLLAGDDNEQLGLIAEEVREVCPQLSDGKTVSYDRLAILLLADWQERHAAAA